MNKYIIIWQQFNTMRPVADRGETGGFAYSTKGGTAGALVIDSIEEAYSLVAEIYKKHGYGQYLVVINAAADREGWTQERLDGFLPHNSWLRKYVDHVTYTPALN